MWANFSFLHFLAASFDVPSPAQNTQFRIYNWPKAKQKTVEKDTTFRLQRFLSSQVAIGRFCHFSPPPAASRKRRSNRRHFERTFMLVSREKFRNPSIDLNSQFFRRYQLFVTVLFWISGPRKSGARLRHLRLRFEECPCGSLLQMQSASKGGSAAPGEKNISLRTLLFRLGLRTHLNSNFSFRITNSRSCRAVERSQTCLPSFKS